MKQVSSKWKIGRVRDWICEKPGYSPFYFPEYKQRLCILALSVFIYFGY